MAEERNAWNPASSFRSENVKKNFQLPNLLRSVFFTFNGGTSFRIYEVLKIWLIH